MDAECMTTLYSLSETFDIVPYKEAQKMLLGEVGVERRHFLAISGPY